MGFKAGVTKLALITPEKISESFYDLFYRDPKRDYAERSRYQLYLDRVHGALRNDALVSLIGPEKF